MTQHLMKQFATLPQKKNTGAAATTTAEEKAAAGDEETAAEGTTTAEVGPAAPTAASAEAPLSHDQVQVAMSALCSKSSPGKPPASLAPPAPGVIATTVEGALAGAESGTSNGVGPSKRPIMLDSIWRGRKSGAGVRSMLDAVCGGTPAGGSDEQPNSVLQFEPTRVVDLENFLQEWSVDLRPKVVEYAFNAEWPDGRLAANEKQLKNLATAYAFTAMATLGCHIDRGISPGSVLEELVKPNVGFYVSAGETGPWDKSATLRGGGGAREGSITRRPIRIAVSIRAG